MNTTDKKKTQPLYSDLRMSNFEPFFVDSKTFFERRERGYVKSRDMIDGRPPRLSPLQQRMVTNALYHYLQQGFIRFATVDEFGHKLWFYEGTLSLDVIDKGVFHTAEIAFRRDLGIPFVDMATNTLNQVMAYDINAVDKEFGSMTLLFNDND